MDDKEYDKEINKEIKKKQYKDFIKTSIYYNIALLHMTKKHTPYTPLNMVGWLKREFEAHIKIHNKL